MKQKQKDTWSVMVGFTATDKSAQWLTLARGDYSSTQNREAAIKFNSPKDAEAAARYLSSPEHFRTFGYRITNAQAYHND